MAGLKELSEVFHGKRNPHWVYLALPALGAAIGLHVYLQTLDLSAIEVRSTLQPLVFSFALPLFAFLALFCALLMHFNTRAINTDYPIVIQDGEFKYEEELHIALRVETLKNLIRSLVERIKKEEDARRILFESGEFAGADFGRKFPEIYLKELKERHHDVAWSSLSVQQKFELWREWDKGVGWGIFQAIDDGRGGFHVENHHVSLYTGAGGQLVAIMLAGYIAGVVQEVTGERLRMVGDPAIGRDQYSILVQLGR